MKTILENLPNWAKWIPVAVLLAYIIFIMCLYTNARQNARENPTPYNQIKR